jgi:hypothetical protein
MIAGGPADPGHGQVGCAAGRVLPMVILRLSMLVPFLARGAAGTARSVTASGRHR